jgi:hypothetical protein
MPMDFDKPTEKASTARSRRKAETPNHENELNDLNATDRSNINALAQAGINGINTQVFAFDSRLTQYEKETGKQMADRVKQSPLRIQHYFLQELQAEQPECQDFSVTIEDAIEVPDLTSNFLHPQGITPSSAMGALPIS